MIDKISIAVLPFVNISSDRENEYFSDGITEEIINALSKIKGLQVTSRTSSFYFKNKHIDVRDIGKQLNVSTILEGSVRKSNNKVRITAQLINVKDRSHYWSETYNRQLDDIFSVQDEISEKVANKVREYLGHFTFEEDELLSLHDNINTYELYLRSKFNFNKFNKEDVELALKQIEEVIASTPMQAKYHATKSVYYTYLALFNSILMEDAFNIASKSAKRALSLNSNDAEAHFAKSVIAFVFEGDINKAQIHSKLAVENKPNYPEALMASAIVALVMGDFTLSFKYVKKMMEIDPFSAITKYYYAVIIMRLGKLEEALSVINEAIKLAPLNVNYYQAKGVVLTRMGKFDEAIKHYNNMPNSVSETKSYYPGLAIVYAYMKNKEKALDYLSNIPDDTPNAYFGYAENPHVAVHTLLENYDQAFQYLEKDVINNKFYLKFYRTLPYFKDLREDKRSSVLDKIFITKGNHKENNQIKYAKSGLSENDLNLLNDRLTEYMLKNKPYLDKNINLNSLASDLKVSANHLSQVINDKHKKNFFWFINEYRIKEVEELLKDSKNKKYTLLGIAYNAGFNSKTTFNTTFKKIKAKTPSQYFKEKKLL